MIPALLSGWLALGAPARAQEGGRPAAEAHAEAPAAAGVERVPGRAMPSLDRDGHRRRFNAQDLPWYVGLVVAQVSLEAPLGGLPRENLEPLLRLTQGAIFDPALVRQDIALLLRAGAFASVEVDAEPWFSIDEHGEPAPAVRITYRVYPPSRIDRVDIEGVRGAARRTVQAAHALGRGEAFFPRRDGPAAERRVREALVAAGWPDAQVDVISERLGENRLRLELRVDTGPPRVLEQVVLAANLPIEDRKVRRVLRRAGLKEHHRITDEGARRGREAVRQMLVDGGYLDPRVTLLFSAAPEGGEVLAILGEAGARTEVAATGAGAPSAGRLREIVGLQAGVRMSEGTVEDAVVDLRDWYQARGWYEVELSPRVERSGDDALLVLAVERGRRHRVVDIEVEGAAGLSPETVAAALRVAAPDSLGRGVLVDGSVAGASRTVRELYRGRGYLDVQVEVGEAEVIGKPRWRPPFSWAVPLRLPVTVQEGELTTLGSLEVEGASSAASEQVARARRRLVGEPYHQGELDSLRQVLVTELRSEGFLGADIKLEVTREERLAHARLVVQPGQQARLRSVIIQGNTRTRRSVIARELTLEVGQPISPEAIEETRRRLYELDLFRVVTLELVGEDDRARDLIVRIEERAPVLLELSGGVATDRGVAARARVAHRNLAGLGHRVSLLGQAGYAWQGDEWDLDLLSPVWRAAIRYEAPNLPARGQRLIAEVLLNEVVQEPTFRTSDIGGSIGVRVHLSEHTDAFLAYGGKQRTLEDVDPGALVVGDPWLGVLNLSEPTTGELDLRGARRVITGPSLAVIMDHRDDPLDPRRGWRASGLLDIQDGLLVKQASVRGEARLDQLVPMGPLILALGGTGGLGWAQGGTSTLPVEERFYLGGSGSLRGFRPGSVGPANEVPRSDIDYPDAIDPFIRGSALAAEPTHWVITGGDAMAAATIELRVPLSTLGLEGFDDAWLVTFGDVGRIAFLGSAVQPTSRAQGVDPLVRYGIGGGLRLSTAIGPVSLLVGLNPERLTERDESQVLVHFTLGDL